MTEEAQAVAWYVWTCPVCGEVQETQPPDVEPSGEEIECRDCATMVTVSGT
jgi:hypothetical protein